MADRKITDLTALAAGSQATGDLLTIVDVSESAAADKNKKITVENLLKGIPSDVGIGTASPAYNLSVESTSGTSINIKAGTSSTARLRFGDSDDDDIGQIIYDNGGNSMRFHTNASERMRIDSSGRLLIGTTTAVGTSNAVIIKGTSGVSNASIYLGNTANASTLVAGNTLGFIEYGAADGGTGAQVLAAADGTWSSTSDCPTRLVFSTTADGAASPTERMRIDSSGNVGIGTTSPNSTLHVAGNLTITKSSNNPAIVFDEHSGSTDPKAQIQMDQTNSTNASLLFSTEGAGTLSERMRIDSSGNVGINLTPSGDSKLQINGSMRFGGSGTASDSTNPIIYRVSGADTLAFASGNSERMRIDSSGRLLIGTTSGSYDLEVKKSGNVNILVGSTDASGATLILDGDSNGDGSGSDYATVGHSSSGHLEYKNRKSSGAHTFHTGSSDTERMRIDSSGDVGIGNSNPSGGASSGADRILNIASGSTAGTSHITFGDSNASGVIESVNGSGTIAINGAHNVTIGTGGSSSERMRIDSSGRLMVGKTSASASTNGGELRTGSSDYAGLFVATSHAPVLINRRTTDGVLVVIRQNDTEEGTISVSGSTVSYNGAHLSRWSQLAGGAERIEILRGSVLSNLDEMCEWGEEDNEQLNRMKVSDVEGDVNVSGVFQAWDDDDDTYTNDFYCAMTGDFVIRIAQGTTVARGDLLMSAGDGTAKPQDDDIVRSKTIAKVTSTTVSNTYADGSYCIPCVLMAC